MAPPSLYEIALRARLVDERLAQLARAGRIGFHPDSRGLEPAIVASVLAMRPEDHVFPGVRDHAAALARGLPIARYLAHVIGAASDPMQGHAAPGRLSVRELRIAPPGGLVSSHLTHAAGFAWAARLRKDGAAVLTLFGPAAADAGDFHSGVNFAGVTRAPVVFLCLAGGARAPSPVESVADKAIAYGVEAERCGGSPEDVAAAVGRARERAARGEGPTLLEAARPEGDPLDLVRAARIADGAWDAQRDLELRRQIAAEIEAALARVLAEPSVSSESLFESVFSEVPAHLARERDELLASPAAGAAR